MTKQTVIRTTASHAPSEPTARSIRLYLPDGTTQGLMIAQIGNWNGQALCAPRGRISDLIRRSEATRTGLYILLGPDPDRAGGLKAYVGEADNVAGRLRNHLSGAEKDFFERVVVVVSSDGTLTKAHARYLESRLIAMVKEAEAVALDNSTTPDFWNLPEADRADMDYFAGQLRLVLQVLGFDLFRRPVEQRPATDASGNAGVFTFTTAGATATARETEDGFVVDAGSTARKAGTDTFPEGYRALRDQLAQEGRLVESADPEFYRFAKDVVFASPSAAASVVAARSASGPREWKIEGNGVTYREWRSQQLGDT